mgnify:CR=1 FL=1
MSLMLCDAWWRVVKDDGRAAFAVGEAALRTNPLYGRGCSVGIIHTPSVKLPATLAAIQNILRQESVRRGWNEAADYCRT